MVTVRATHLAFNNYMSVPGFVRVLNRITEITMANTKPFTEIIVTRDNNIQIFQTLFYF